MNTCLHFRLSGLALLVPVLSLVPLAWGCSGNGTATGGGPLSFVDPGSTGESTRSFIEAAARSAEGNTGPQTGSTGETTSDFLQPGGGSGGGGGGSSSSGGGSRISDLSPSELLQLCQDLAVKAQAIQCEDFDFSLEEGDIEQCAQEAASVFGACGLTVGDVDGCFSSLAASCNPSGCGALIACFNDDSGGGPPDTDVPPAFDAGTGNPNPVDTEQLCGQYCGFLSECGAEIPDCASLCAMSIGGCSAEELQSFLSACTEGGCEAIASCAEPPACAG